MTDKQTRGEQAERAAETHLRQQGLKPIARNHHCHGGEIDLIMQDGEHLVFVEVRLRTHAQFGGALASVDARKQRRIALAAQHYLQQHPWNGPCRFDVVGLNANGQVDWIRDAFYAE